MILNIDDLKMSQRFLLKYVLDVFGISRVLISTQIEKKGDRPNSEPNVKRSQHPCES